MAITSKKINFFLLAKLPAAYFTGVRVKKISEDSCITTVRYRWINQNPFNSIFWAVQGMAAELSTGALVMSCIKNSNVNVSMLVVKNNAVFIKKARGLITFSCNDGYIIKNAINRTMATNEGQTCWMKSEGKDSSGDIVSIFEFEWSVKLKN